MTIERSPESRGGQSDLPTWSMLMYGHFFGDASPRSQRAKRRARIGMLVFLCAFLAASFVPGLTREARSVIVGALVGSALTYSAWEAWRYTTGLDELARRLYLEAFAITYLIGLAMFSTLGMLEDVAGWKVSPMVFMVLEPVRAAVLTWRSRRFV